MLPTLLDHLRTQMNQVIKQITQATSLSTQQAWWLLEFVTNKSQTWLMTNKYDLSSTQQDALDNHIYEIGTLHKPLAYILGFVPFLDLEIMVKSPILIPRPETENWVDQLIVMLQASTTQDFTILDIGTGTGCIALSLAKAFPAAKVYAVDINPQALELAKNNAIKNNICNIIFIESDLFKAVPDDLIFDLIVSNPPYINPSAQLDPSVANWEDHGALFADHEGMNIIDQICKQAPSRLAKKNNLKFQLVLEIDTTQGAILEKLLQQSGFQETIIQKDQFDRDRTAWSR